MVRGCPGAGGMSEACGAACGLGDGLSGSPDARHGAAAGRQSVPAGVCPYGSGGFPESAGIDAILRLRSSASVSSRPWTRGRLEKPVLENVSAAGTNVSLRAY